jgi:hypothetical protein
MQTYRERLRAQGLKPVQVWVPDIDDPEFAAEARRQSLMVRDDPHEQELLSELESVSDQSEWKP